MNEDNAMQLPKRAPKLEWNLNTLLQLASIVSMLALGGYVWANTQRDIEDLKTWRAGHELLHKERLAEVRSNDARTDERFKNVEGEVRKIEQLSYRLGAAESTANSISTALKELQAAFAQQSGDLKVIREILQRLESGQQRSGR